VFFGFVRIAAVEGPLGPTIQIFDEDVVACTRLIDLTLLLISTTFPYLCDCRLSDAEASHADGNCHANECNSDTAQSLLPDVQGLSVRSHRNARAPSPGDGVAYGPLARDIGGTIWARPWPRETALRATADLGGRPKALGIGRASVYRVLEAG
jgi:hypothetical protein